MGCYLFFFLPCGFGFLWLYLFVFCWVFSSGKSIWVLLHPVWDFFHYKRYSLLLVVGFYCLLFSICLGFFSPGVPGFSLCPPQQAILIIQKKKKKKGVLSRCCLRTFKLMLEKSYFMMVKIQILGSFASCLELFVEKHPSYFLAWKDSEFVVWLHLDSLALL